VGSWQRSENQLAGGSGQLAVSGKNETKLAGGSWQQENKSTDEND